MNYDLSAILIHYGSGTHSGHYVAQINDTKTHVTFKFNDSLVETLGPNTFDLVNDEEQGKTNI